jgi:hypothetical protein
MPPVTPPGYTPLPTPVPQRSDPVNFAARADAFLTALPDYQTELDAIGEAAYDNAVSAQTDASSALSSKNAAAASEAAAANSAITAAAAASAPLWVSGTNYAQYTAVQSPITLLSYKAKVALNPSTVDPADDPANWRILSDFKRSIVVTGTSVTAVAGMHYILTNVAATTVTGPASASADDEYWITVANSLDTNTISRNGLTYMGLAENVNLDLGNITTKWKYVNSTWRLV